MESNHTLCAERGRLVGMSYRRIVLALLIASTGFDVLEVHFGDDRIRITYPIYLLLFVLLLRHMRFPRTQTLLVGAFLILSTIGMCLIGINRHSILYLAWVLASFGTVYPLFYYFAREHREDFVPALLLAGRAQIVVGFLLFATRIEYRAQDLYYEPSYMAFGLIPYIGMVAWLFFERGRRRPWWDIGLLLAALVSTGSAMLLIAVFVAWVVGTLVNGLRLRQVAGALASMAALFAVLVLYAQFSTDLLATTVKAIISSPDIVQTLVERGGDRVPRMLAAIYIFGLHPLLGVGIGQYRAVSTEVNLSRFAHGQAYLTAQNEEAINIYVELLATTGIPAALVFFAFLIRSVTLQRFRDMTTAQKQLFVGLATMLLMLNVEANYLRPYLWMMLGAYAGIAARPLEIRNRSRVSGLATGETISSGLQARARPWPRSATAATGTDEVN